MAQATCGDKDGAGGNSDAVSDAECGEGFIYNSANSASTCAGTTCDISGTAADKSACCVALATCGDKDGAGSGTAAVTNADCGAGLIYDTGSSSSTCAGTTCDVSSSGSDKSTCCQVHP